MRNQILIGQFATILANANKIIGFNGSGVPTAFDRVGGSSGQLQWNNAGVPDGVGTYTSATQSLALQGSVGIQKDSVNPGGSQHAWFSLRNSDAGGVPASPSFSGDGGTLYAVSTSGSLNWLGSSGPAMNLSGNLPITTISADSYTITEADRGRILKFTSNNPITLTLASLTTGFVAKILKTGTDVLTFAGFSQFLTVGSITTLTDVNGTVVITHQGANVWYGEGNLS